MRPEWILLRVPDDEDEPDPVYLRVRVDDIVSYAPGADDYSSGPEVELFLRGCDHVHPVHIDELRTLDALMKPRKGDEFL